MKIKTIMKASFVLTALAATFIANKSVHADVDVSINGSNIVFTPKNINDQTGDLDVAKETSYLRFNGQAVNMVNGTPISFTVSSPGIYSYQEVKVISMKDYPAERTKYIAGPDGRIEQFINVPQSSTDLTVIPVAKQNPTIKLKAQALDREGNLDKFVVRQGGRETTFSASDLATGEIEIPILQNQDHEETTIEYKAIDKVGNSLKDSLGQDVYGQLKIGVDNTSPTITIPEEEAGIIATNTGKFGVQVKTDGFFLIKEVSAEVKQSVGSYHANLSIVNESVQVPFTLENSTSVFIGNFKANTVLAGTIPGVGETELDSIKILYDTLGPQVSWKNRDELVKKAYLFNRERQVKEEIDYLDIDNQKPFEIAGEDNIGKGSQVGFLNENDPSISQTKASLFLQGSFINQLDDMDDGTEGEQIAQIKQANMLNGNYRTVSANITPDPLYKMLGIRRYVRINYGGQDRLGNKSDVVSEEFQLAGVYPNNPVVTPMSGSARNIEIDEESTSNQATLKAGERYRLRIPFDLIIPAEFSRGLNNDIDEKNTRGNITIRYTYDGQERQIPITSFEVAKGKEFYYLNGTFGIPSDIPEGAIVSIRGFAENKDADNQFDYKGQLLSGKEISFAIVSQADPKSIIVERVH